MDVKTFLESKNYSFANEIEFKPYNPELAKTVMSLNFDSVALSDTLTKEAMMKALDIADNNVDKVIPSYQPMNEAAIFISGETLDKSAVSSLVNNSLGKLTTDMSKWEATDKLAERVDFSLSEEAIAEIKEAQKILSTGVLGLANTNDLANSSFNVSATTIKMGSNYYHISADNGLFSQAPIIENIASTHITQAKSIQGISDVNIMNTKNNLVDVEGTNTIIAQNTTIASSQTLVLAEQSYSNKAVDEISNTANKVNNYGGSQIVNNSKGVIQNQAKEAIANTAPILNIVATSGGKSDKPVSTETGAKWNSVNGLEGQSKFELGSVQGIIKAAILPKLELAKPNIINFVSEDNGLQKGKINTISGQWIASTSQHYNWVTGGNMTNVAKGNLTHSTERFANYESDIGTNLTAQVFMRQQVGFTGQVFSSGFTFSGFRFGKLKKFIDKAKNVLLFVKKISSFSEIPTLLLNQDLADCLPKNDSSLTIQDSDTTTIGTPPITNENILATPELQGSVPTKKELGDQTHLHPTPTGSSTTAITGKELQSNINEFLTSDNFEVLNNKNNTKIPISNEGKIGGNSLLSANFSPLDQSESGNTKNRYIVASGIFVGGADIYLKKGLDNPSKVFEDLDAKLDSPNGLLEGIDVDTYIKEVDALTKLDFENAIKSLSIPTEFNKLVLENIEFLKSYLKSKYTNEEEEINETLFKELIKLIEVKAILDELEENIKAKLAVGGFLNTVSNILDRVSNTINVVSDRIENNQSNVNIFQQLKTGAQIASELTGAGVFTDALDIINGSESLSNLYRQVKGLNENPNNTLANTIENINFSDVKNLVTEGLNTIGINSPQLELVSNISSILNNIKQSTLYKEQGLTQEVENQILSEIARLPNSSIQIAKTIYTGLESTINNILQGDIETLIKGSELQNLLSFFIGSSNVSMLNNIRNIYNKVERGVSSVNNLIKTGEGIIKTGKTLFESISKIPDLLNLMNNNAIPPLQQVSTVLKCLDLINQSKDLLSGIEEGINQFDNFIDQDVQNLFSNLNDLFGTNNAIEVPSIEITNAEEITIEVENLLCDKNIVLDNVVDNNHSEDVFTWTEKPTTEEVLNIVETLPRLTQIFNSIKQTPTVELENLNLDLSVEELNKIKKLEIKERINSCYPTPKLNLVESTVEILDIKQGTILYKMKHLNALKYNNKYILPNTNTIVQMYVDKFFNNKTRINMNVNKSLQFYTANVYSFKTTEFNIEKNRGIAYIINTQNRVHLINEIGVTYAYSIYDVGTKLTPNILDAYIME